MESFVFDNTNFFFSIFYGFFKTKKCLQDEKYRKKPHCHDFNVNNQHWQQSTHLQAVNKLPTIQKRTLTRNQN